MPPVETRKQQQTILWEKRFLEMMIDHILKNGIVLETAGGTLNKLIGYLRWVNSRKSMVTVNLVQNVPITQDMWITGQGSTKTDFCLMMSDIIL